ncbi:hypothetical protein Sango_2957700 [Sesamum angolense]|uniref:Tf2-1-like SH3-like domain-containing protein n=1 Tax=Sesamum angolense TaxID=2727404 RepID=A0AAE1T4P3_9LAMI|nr:hypothetical protein Sango_2957700 [Sesamum angolense]
MNTKLEVDQMVGLLATLPLKPDFVDQIQEAQTRDPFLLRMLERMKHGSSYCAIYYASWYYKDLSEFKTVLLVADNEEGCGRIYGEVYDMSVGLPRTFRKHDAIWVIVHRLTKSAHLLPIRLGDSLDKFAKFMVPYEALYGRRCRSSVCSDIEGLRQLEGPELVQETVEKIRIVKKCLKAAQDWQKSFADKHRRDMEYKMGDKVFLKVSPCKGILRFGKQGKLSPRYIELYEITERIGSLAYRLALPSKLSQIHDIFMSRCYDDIDLILATSFVNQR